MMMKETDYSIARSTIKRVKAREKSNELRTGRFNKVEKSTSDVD